MSRSPLSLRHVAFVLTLPWLAACGTLRLYDGPELARDEVARVHEMSDPMSWMSSARAVVTSFDGTTLDSHSETTLEMLPGPHSLGVEGESLGAPITGTLNFTAAAGGDYELWLSTGAHSDGAIVLRDSAHGSYVADTEPKPEQARSAELTFESGWHVVNWHRSETQVGQVWVPAGETQQQWSQSVSTGAQRAEGGEAGRVLDGQIEMIRSLAARSQPVPEVDVVDSGPTYRVLTMSVETPTGSGPWALTCLRVQDGVVHRLSYSARSHADYDANAQRWRAAFLAAPVAFPGP